MTPSYTARRESRLARGAVKKRPTVGKGSDPALRCWSGQIVAMYCRVRSKIACCAKSVTDVPALTGQCHGHAARPMGQLRRVGFCGLGSGGRDSDRVPQLGPRVAQSGEGGCSWRASGQPGRRQHTRDGAGRDRPAGSGCWMPRA